MDTSKEPKQSFKTDFLIIGQGICGTFLSENLIKAGKNVLVIDDDQAFTASKVASGVINPVTGRRIVRTWRIEELLPFAIKAYNDLGNRLGVKLMRECNVLDFHTSNQMKETFDKRLVEESEFLHTVDSSPWQQTFNFHFGVGEIRPCLLVDIPSMLCNWRKRLQEQNILIEEKFITALLSVTAEDVTYKNIIAKKIIYCDGVAGVENPYFKNLPYSPNKGEAVIANIPHLDRGYIYKHGFSIVPWKEDLFWIGSSYEWNHTDHLPSTSFKEKVERFLKFFLKMPYEIVDHIASVRPANMERRPFVGLHPKFRSVGILNGMGTKGCSLAPFFAKQLADHLVDGKAIFADADVNRFEKILSRNID